MRYKKNSLELPLADWLDKILQVVNSDDRRKTAERLRRRLVQLIEDSLPGRRRLILANALPPLEIAVSRKGARLHDGLNPSEDDIDDIRQRGWPRWLADRYATTFDGMVFALAADPMGALVRRCTQCDRFYRLKRNHVRPNQFCTKQCGRAFDYAKRDQNVYREYVRKHRRKKTEARREQERMQREQEKNQRAQEKVKLEAAWKQLRSRR